MTFLEPVYLFALGLAAAPPLLHLFARRRLDDVPFTALRFLVAFEKRSASSLTLRQLLILLCRMAALACMAMCFAQPANRSPRYDFLHDKSRVALTIILDDSYSMGWQRQGVRLFDRARSLAMESAAGLSEDDEVTVYSVCGGAVATEKKPGDAMRAMRRMRLGSCAGDIMKALKDAMDEQQGGATKDRRVLLVSDMQDSNIRSAKIHRAKPEARAAIVSLSEGVGSRANMAIERVDAPSNASPGEAAKVCLKTGRSGSDGKNRSVSLLVNGRRRGEKAVVEGNGGTCFQLEFGRPGDVEGSAQLNHDALTADNTTYFRFTVRPPATSFLLSDTAGSQDPRHDAFYLWRALRAATVGASQSGAKMDLSAVVPEHAGVSTVVVVPSERLLNNADAGSLMKFVEDGGGALLFLGKQSDADRAIESSLFGGELKIARGQQSNDAGTLRLERIQRTHPIFAPMESQGSAMLSETRFRDEIRLRPLSTDVNAPAMLSDGSPLIVERALGKGKIMLVRSGLDPEETNMALMPYFPAFIDRAVAYLADRPEARDSVIQVGEPIRLIVPKARGSKRLTATLRGAGTNVVTLYRAGGAGEDAYTGSGASSPGMYDVKEVKSGRRVGAFAVNPDPAEGVLRYIGIREARRRLQGFSPRAIVDGRSAYGEIRAFASGNRYNRLWKLFLLGALVLLIIDGVLSNRD